MIKGKLMILEQGDGRDQTESRENSLQSSRRCRG